MLCVCVCVLLGKQSLAPFYYQWSITKSIYKQPYLLTGTRVAQERLTPTAVNSLYTKLPSLSYLSDRERWDGVERERGGVEDWTSFVLSSVCAYMCMIMSVWKFSSDGVNAKRYMLTEREREGGGEEEWAGVEDGLEGRGVSFDMSFLKLSFDNWQFVQLVKCQESKKIDEVHNRCLRLTLRCGLESHARTRPPKRYRN